MEDHGGADNHIVAPGRPHTAAEGDALKQDASHGEPMLELAPGRSCSPWRKAHAEASFLAETAAHWGPTLEQSIPEGLQPTERAHGGAVHEGWYPVGGTPH